MTETTRVAHYITADCSCSTCAGLRDAPTPWQTSGAQSATEGAFVNWNGQLANVEAATVAEPYVSNGYKWAGGSFGSSGGTVTWSYATSNYSNRETFDATISSFMPSGYDTEIQNSFSAWSAVANISFSQVSDSSSVGIRLGGGNMDGAGGTLAVAWTSYSGTTISQVDIIFDVAESWSVSNASLELISSVATHEIGHGIGLCHSASSSAIMYAFNNNVTALSSDDIAGGQYLYGAKSTTTSATTGTTGADSLSGTSSADTIYGSDGNDTVIGGSGADGLYGNKDSDTVSGGEDGDSVFGGQGNDFAHGDNGSDRVYGNLGDDSVYGDNGTDSVYGGQGNDCLYGGDSNDYLNGNRGDDTIWGDGTSASDGSGTDTIDGGDGTDTAVYLFERANYTLTRNADGSISVSGFDQVYNCEYLRFSDQTVTISTI
jgi:Ca2+-binding RTX toxin-like protein